MAIVIRRATRDDAAAIAHVHVDSWRSTYAGMLPETMLLRLSSTRKETRWWGSILASPRRRHYIYVAEDGKEGVIGFASGGPSRDRELREEGEIYALYLLDHFHGIGVGKALFLALAERLQRDSGKSLVVWVLKANPSRFFYEAMGGRRTATRLERMGDVEVESIAYGWESLPESVPHDRSRYGS